MDRILCTTLALFLSILFLIEDAYAADMWPGTPVKITGEIEVPPCEIDAPDRIMVADFGTIVDKYLYLNTRTHSIPFEIHLLHCSSANDLVITFKGQESKELPGLLAFGSDSLASGAAIGLELPDGMLLPINKPTPKFDLVSGSNTFTIKAYVQGEPGALQSHSIGRGYFNAVATFYLDYP